MSLPQAGTASSSSPGPSVSVGPSALAILSGSTASTSTDSLIIPRLISTLQSLAGPTSLIGSRGSATVHGSATTASSCSQPDPSGAGTAAAATPQQQQQHESSGSTAAPAAAMTTASLETSSAAGKGSSSGGSQGGTVLLMPPLQSPAASTATDHQLSVGSAPGVGAVPHAVTAGDIHPPVLALAIDTAVLPGSSAATGSASGILSSLGPTGSRSSFGTTH